MPHGKMLLQWQATGYHLAMMFSAEGRMLGITHESAHFYDAPRGCLGVVALVAVVILATICAVGQQKELQHLPISNYMSEVGLLYIEDAQNYYDACRHAGSYEAAQKRWDKIFEASTTESPFDYALQFVRRAILNSSNCFR